MEGGYPKLMLLGLLYEGGVGSLNVGSETAFFKCPSSELNRIN